MMCEKCWAEAYTLYLFGGQFYESQGDAYRVLLKGREGNPCPSCQQSGACRYNEHREECALASPRKPEPPPNRELRDGDIKAARGWGC